MTRWRWYQARRWLVERQIPTSYVVDPISGEELAVGWLIVVVLAVVGVALLGGAIVLAVAL